MYQNDDLGTNWSFQDCPVVNPSEDHMTLLILCDISGSMNSETEFGKRRIDMLNDALSMFKDVVCADPKTARSLEVGIVAFDHTQQVVQPFTPIKQFNFTPLSSKGGGTKIAAVAQLALDMLQAHVVNFTTKGIALRKPWVMMITDGRPEHDSFDELEQAAERVRGQDAAGKLRFWSFGVGEYDRDTLVKFSAERAIDLSGYNFSSMIDWTVKSMRAISAAAPGQMPQSAAIDPSNGMQQVVTLPG